MAIVKNLASTATKLVLDIDNGDLEALNEIKSSWNFSSKENALRFALAILKKAISGGKKIYIEEGGDKIPVKPSDNLLEEENNTETPA